MTFFSGLKNFSSFLIVVEWFKFLNLRKTLALNFEDSNQLVFLDYVGLHIFSNMNRIFFENSKKLQMVSGLVEHLKQLLAGKH